MAQTYTFFLGGYDLEMATIRQLLDEHLPAERIHDRKLGWGAKASAYQSEIRRAIERGGRPVLIELENDLGLKTSEAILVDHHGDRAGSVPTSLEQVFGLLELAPQAWRENRELQLVAANDRGHIEAMLALRATPAEITDIRARDRAAQGITEEEEAQAEQAVNGAEWLAGDALAVVTLPHTRTATVTDRLHEALGGPGYRNLLVVSPGELDFFGEGRVICALNREFPGGWMGGELPRRGFWGHLSPLEASGVKSFIERRLETGNGNEVGSPG